jgi:preprotein translocase subunit SecE
LVDRHNASRIPGLNQRIRKMNSTQTIEKPKPIERFKGFVKEVRLEMSKVTWPTRGELRDSTVVVIISCIVISAFIGVVDYILYSMVKIVF